jgi:5-carboxymethyl-2-hydroxymuconate isomerase
MLNEIEVRVPHQIIEYSANLDELLDISALVDALHLCAEGQEELPIGGLRTRAYPSRDYLIADRHPDNAFIAVCLRVGEGSREEVLERVGKTLFDSLCEAVKDTLDDQPLALSYEVQVIDPRLRWNKNNLREQIGGES